MFARGKHTLRFLVLGALALPLLASPFACTAILGDFSVGNVGSDSGPVSDAPNDGPSDTTHFIDALQVVAGLNHTCALRKTGEVYCWGDNSLGQLGTSSVNGTSTTPVKVANLQSIRALAAGDNHTCAVDGSLTGGSVYCWGNNSKGQLGSSSAGATSAIPVKLTAPTGVTDIAAGKDVSCSLDSGGSLNCWGDNSSAQLGGGTTDSSQHASPTAVATLFGAQAVSVGGEVACGLISGTPVTIECWGNGLRGEIPGGDGGTIHGPTTIAIGSAGTNMAHVSAGSTHACATDTSGAVYCWGSNDFGESGQATPIGGGASVAPTAVAGLTGVGAIATGDSYSCALTVAQYGVSCWGRNTYGNLGDGQPSTGDPPQPVPQAVGGLSGIGQLSAGPRHACAIVKTVPTLGQADTSAGPVYCWGDNTKGQLGDGTQGNQRNSPVQVTKPPS